MTKDRKLVTKKGFIKLEEELKNRMTKLRKEIADRLDEAKAVGDLSENSAYHAALEEYRFNETRINKLKELISTLEVAPNKRGDAIIDIGDKVKVRDKKSKRVLTYAIVGLREGDPTKGQVSSDSIVGSALVGMRVGQKVKVKLPVGEKEYEIIEIG